MPQMSPLNWTFLFLYFMILMMMILYKIYFYSHPKNNQMFNKKFLNENIKWQW